MKHLLRSMLAFTFFFPLVCSTVVLGQTFSIDAASPGLLLPPGYTPDDLSNPLWPALVAPGGVGEVDAISYGHNAIDWGNIGSFHFSVDRLSLGVPGSAVFVESTAAGGSEPAADVFMSFGLGGNVQTFDGDGVLTPPNAGAPLGLVEPAGGGDDLDAWDLRLVSPSLWFSVDSPTAAGYGAPSSSGADVWFSALAPGYDAPTPARWATAAALGLSVGDEIDALVVFDGDSDPDYDAGIDYVLFSLAPGSPYIGTIDPGGSGLAIMEGDILWDGLGTASIFVSAEAVGLDTLRSGGGNDDNLDALDVAIIPEPTTALLLMGGLSLLAVFAKRRASVADRPAAFHS